MRRAEDHGLLYSRASFERLLKNPAYAGKTYNGHICEPYISPDQHDLIMSVKHSRALKNHPNRVYLFSGICVCGYCGRRMVGKSNEHRKLKNGDITIYPKYACQGDRDTFNRCPRHLQISEAKLERCLLSRIDVEIGHLRYRASITNKEMAERIKAREMLNKRLERAKEMYIDGDISKDMYLTKKRQIEHDLSAIPVEREKIPELPDQWQEVYTALDPEGRQMFWKKILSKIVITNETKDEPKIFFN